MKNIRLYSYWRSSCSWRVRIALHHKRIPFETVPVHLINQGGEQHLPEFVAKSPVGQVPLLEWEDGEQVRSLPQSTAICLYLEDRVPEYPLLPVDPFARARVWAAAEIVASGVQPLQNLSVLQHAESLGVEPKQWGAHWNQRGLLALEQFVASESGPFLFGASLTLADVFLVPQLFNARRFDVPLDAMPRLLAAEAACRELPEFVAADASNQPDTAKDA